MYYPTLTDFPFYLSEWNHGNLVKNIKSGSNESVKRKEREERPVEIERPDNGSAQSPEQHVTPQFPDGVGLGCKTANENLRVRA